MDSSEQAALAVSLVAMAAAGAMAWRTLRRQRQVPPDQRARQMRRFTRRRIIMSVVLGVVGLALLWDALALDAWFKRPPPHLVEFTTFWVGIIAALLLLLGLAIADIYAVLFAQISEHYRKDHWKAGRR